MFLSSYVNEFMYARVVADLFFMDLLVYAHRHEAERMEQEAKGRLERQKITDEAEAEKARSELLDLQAKR